MLSKSLWPALVAGVVSAIVWTGAASAQKKYDPGASDTEIKIGQTMPYSGPASSYATIGLVMKAYFDKINAEGGVNGRKITLLSQDDGFVSSKTVEATRKLVEQDDVLFIAGSLGTAPNAAVQKYLNIKKVPQLFVATGATRWGDPEHFPWTMGWQPSYQIEGAILGRYTAATYPTAKIGVLYQNDDSGKDYIKGFKAGLGDAAKLIVAETSYELSDPTVDSQVITLKTAGADVFFLHANPRFVAQAIRRTFELTWKPAIILPSVGASVGAALAPAGLEKSIGAVTAAYMKDPTDKVWESDKGFQDWLAFMKQWYPRGSLIDGSNVYGYSMAQTIVQVLRQCGDVLTRENVMQQAASMKDLELPMLLPGIDLSTSAKDFFPIKQMRLARFDGTSWIVMPK
ncbi:MULTISPECIES: ABC transporter substrate-binding protein [unclassified Bradyrhizobium]|uniref:ABC transporter substrate-binding protein n=1 Tax=unclassified Bradyrhizobium TaxID=2631580 RepID=UPI001BA8CF05|nr:MULTISPECIES: ABC transporter substrate-binding protein [unclassified Bradyrhizobium]MBR1225806.1 ABC transporter substrate-binding protein [Bradyrhizobium sp. AUGA SZCCT0176]MBR1236209.1 ABC transporter substrate-binding protein [Bradyrhizobium sp. AUGA SZCCT0182]MBR1301168.1 ABC transporter substrate-binding protein [Bradyrhizobium sp. AUGA SZCCT0042]